MPYIPKPKEKFPIPSGLKRRAKVLASDPNFKNAFAERWHPQWFGELVRTYGGQHELVIHAGVRLLVNRGLDYETLSKEHGGLHSAMHRLAKQKQMKPKSIWHAHGGK
ncbi:hypothetical protein HYV43_05650 [Candidatus Micrarchaeota archaeon]|nr:hypothetical protein [Candidatus Micrarchaeota archaeon]